ncbi:PIR Superfamily Protein [Plasmodium ovale wallikeri]|uniref:PIR Superfamily Protein n=1 Tax=Plasmodium ovale wallikeri TaxID=864142 RepID=A0A1A9ALJ9_PLAOA|nr:PIR Superfamily Protein [Plasmodium ovale wallikeri]SBT57511.1 PIR Superfamily Protein [Plasmodium ovale wallikeri]
MTKIISEKDLPSIKFDNDAKDRIYYNTLESYIKIIPEDVKIEEWIAQFKTHMEKYLMEPTSEFLLNKDKRCRDFQYLIFDIKQIILNLNKDELGKSHVWKSQIELFHDEIFTRLPFTCNKIHIIDKSDMKNLDDFCEDSAFIGRNLSKIQKSVHCDNIFRNMSNRKDNLMILRTQDEKKGIFTQINDKCSTQFLESICPSIDCNSRDKYTLEHGAPAARINHVDTGEASERLMTQTRSFEQLKNGGTELLTIPTESETDNSSSSNYIGLVSLPILGISVLSLILYKYTPLGSKIYAHFQNKDIPINEGYEATDQMLFNTSNSNDIYSENIKYNISYQTLQG